MSKRFSLVVAIVLAAATLDTGALNAQRPIGSPIGLTLRSALDAEIETTFTTPQGPVQHARSLLSQPRRGRCARTRRWDR